MRKLSALIRWPAKDTNNIRPAWQILPRAALWIIGAAIYWPFVYAAAFGLYLMTLDYWQAKQFKDDAI